jgi:hypothetical protein
MAGSEARLRLRSESLSWRPTVDGEVIALDLAGSRYLSANPAAAQLWTRLADGATQHELEAVLVANFGISTDAARDDVDDFITDLRSRGLLVEAT